MNLYEICGYVSQENEYKEEVKIFKVVDYKEDQYIKFKSLYSENTYTPPCLNEFKIGLLKSELPSITIHTCDGDKIIEFKAKIKDQIRNELNGRLKRTQKQLTLFE